MDWTKMAAALFSLVFNHKERKVLQMIAEGRSTKEISEILCVSPSTVKTHRSNIMEKLKMDNISQLIQLEH